MSEPIFLHEEVHRGVVTALMAHFTSVADAVKELVDNPIDYRWGQKLSIDIKFGDNKQFIVVESDGGRGMGPSELQTWLNWGAGEDHAEDHIGMYHQGGKAATGFLGNHLRLWSKRMGSADVWLVEDEGWATRRNPKDFGPLEPVPLSSLPPSMRSISVDRGHVRIEISKLKHDRRWNIAILKRQLANTYCRLLSKGDLIIRVDDEPLSPLILPIDPKIEKIEIRADLPDGRGVHGWAGRLRRSELPNDTVVRSGFRLYSNNRLMVDNEWFGYRWEGKGALNSLVGELVLVGFTPNTNKTDYTDRATGGWESLSEHVLKQVGPLIGRLRSSGEEAPVTKAEKRRASEVREELSQVLKGDPQPAGASWNSLQLPLGHEQRQKETEIAELGRSKPTDSPSPQSSRKTADKSKPQTPRTPPPDDAVGRLNRILAKLSERGFPEISVRNWESDQRSTLVVEDKRNKVLINAAFPAYRELDGAKAYIAESAIIEVFSKDPDITTIEDFTSKVNDLWWRWSQKVK